MPYSPGMTTGRASAGFAVFIGMGALLAVLTAAGCEQRTTDKDLKLIRLGEVRAAVARSAERPDHALLIDARTQPRFDESHLPAARRMDLPRLDSGGGDAGLNRYSLLIVYGQNPADYVARAMGKRLIQLGYRGVRLFAGGYDEWARAGNPVEKPPSPGPTNTPAPAPLK